MINTICDPSHMTTVKRRNKDGSSSIVNCPESVKMYNKYMGGVDIADMKCKFYSCSRRSKKWWYRMFHYLVDVSVVNSHVIMSETPNIATMSLKNFVIEVARELITSYSSRKRPPNPSGSVPPPAKDISLLNPRRRGSARFAVFPVRGSEPFSDANAAPVTLSTCALRM